MEINRKAPVIATGEIEVSAGPETIWDIMAAIDHWPNWNPAIKSASLDGELIPCSKFRWNASHAAITSILQQVERPKLLIWTGKTFGINAIHVWRLEPKNGRTIVKSEESWDGITSWIFRKSMKKMLQKSIDGGLMYLKAESERRSGADINH